MPNPTGRPAAGGVSVRLARPQEYGAVGALTEAAYRARGLEEESYASQLRAAAERAGRAELYVALADGRLIGTATFCGPGSTWRQIATEEEAELRMLAVDPAGQGRGVGSALTEACIERSRTLALRALVLCTPKELLVAQRLYQRLGFVRTPERDWSPRPSVALVAYALPLRRS